MASRQLLAQIGVFALLGLNVGAYYAFWPPKDSDVRGQAKAPEQPSEQTRLLPQQKGADDFSAPRSIQQRSVPSRQADAPPRTTTVAMPATSHDDPVVRLLKQIENDPAPAPVMPPPLRTTEHEITHDREVKVTTPKTAPELWVITMEKLNSQSLLTAKLRNSNAEFKITCDRVETTTPGGVLAIGNVTVTSTALNVACKRLIVPMHHAQLIFEDQITITSAGSVLRSERLIWEAAAPQGETQPLNRPLELRPSEFIAPLVPEKK